MALAGQSINAFARAAVSVVVLLKGFGVRSGTVKVTVLSKKKPVVVDGLVLVAAG